MLENQLPITTGTTANLLQLSHITVWNLQLCMIRTFRLACIKTYRRTWRSIIFSQRNSLPCSNADPKLKNIQPALLFVSAAGKVIGHGTYPLAIACAHWTDESGKLMAVLDRNPSQIARYVICGHSNCKHGNISMISFRIAGLQTHFRIYNCLE